MLHITFLFLLFACHWAADYTHLSTKWMLDAKRFGTPSLPILAHAAVHATLMGLLTFIFGYGLLSALYVFLFQLVTHFLIDVWKGKMNIWFPILQNPAIKWHWWVFGFDQLLHAYVILTIYFHLV